MFLDFHPFFFDLIWPKKRNRHRPCVEQGRGWLFKFPPVATMVCERWGPSGRTEVIIWGCRGIAELVNLLVPRSLRNGKSGFGTDALELVKAAPVAQTLSWWTFLQWQIVVRGHKSCRPICPGKRFSRSLRGGGIQSASAHLCRRERYCRRRFPGKRSPRSLRDGSSVLLRSWLKWDDRWISILVD